MSRGTIMPGGASGCGGATTPPASAHAAAAPAQAAPRLPSSRQEPPRWARAPPLPGAARAPYQARGTVPQPAPAPPAAKPGPRCAQSARRGGGAAAPPARRGRRSRPGPGWIFVVGDRGAACDECLRVLEQRHEAPGVGALAAQQQLALRLLAALGAASSPRAASATCRRAGACVTSSSTWTELGKRVLAPEREVVVVGRRSSCLRSALDAVGLHARLLGRLGQRDRIRALLPHRQHDRDERDERAAPQAAPRTATAATTRRAGRSATGSRLSRERPVVADLRHQARRA